MSWPAKQSVAPATDRNVALKQEGMGNHWQLLDQAARTKLREILEGHNFAHRVIARHMRQLPSTPSMGDQDVIICLIRRFLDQTKGQASVEDAAVYLARSSWDVRLASYRWIDPENYAAVARDELWGDEENDEANVPDIHKTVRPVLEKDTLQPPVVRNTSSNPEGHHKEHHNKADHYAAFASAATSTTDAELQGRNLADPKEGHNDVEGESRAVVHASGDLRSDTGTDTRGAGYYECNKTSGSSGKKPEPMDRLNPGKDADGDGKAGISANRTADQSVHPSFQREIRSTAGVETSDTTARVKIPNIAASSETVQTAMTTVSLNTTALNANMDRSPAVKGQVTPDKITIVFEQPDQKTHKKHQFPQYNNGKNIDWQNSDHIRSLNKWRNQIFRRALGVVRPGPVNFHKEELDWLTDRYLVHQKKALKHGVEPDYHTMNWVAIVEAFNERFEGRKLPDCDEPRPHRTKTSIMTQRYRIETISKLTGVPLKGEKAKLRALAEAAAGPESREVIGIGTDDSKTVESITSADTRNARTRNESNTAIRSDPVPDEETESSDDGGISDGEEAQPLKRPRFHGF